MITRKPNKFFENKEKDSSILNIQVSNPIEKEASIFDPSPTREEQYKRQFSLKKWRNLDPEESNEVKDNSVLSDISLVKNSSFKNQVDQYSPGERLKLK